jgi:hypothetical protein
MGAGALGETSVAGALRWWLSLEIFLKRLRDSNWKFPKVKKHYCLITFKNYCYLRKITFITQKWRSLVFDNYKVPIYQVK